MHVWHKNWFLLLTQDGLPGPLADRLTSRCAVSACRQDAVLQFRQHSSWNEVADKNNGIFSQLSVLWRQKSFDCGTKIHLNKVWPSCSAPKCHGGRPLIQNVLDFQDDKCPLHRTSWCCCYYAMFCLIMHPQNLTSLLRTWGRFRFIAISFQSILSCQHQIHHD